MAKYVAIVLAVSVVGIEAVTTLVSVFVAPGGYHLQIEPERIFSLSVDPPVNYSIPAIDVLFESAAGIYKEKLIGVVLTGANADGGNGLKKIRESGRLAVVQNPKTADSETMRRAPLRQPALITFWN